jgi:SAM-dependent methyltransferase
MAVPPERRDDWLDLVLGIEEVLDDGPALPRGCVPYLPCSVSALLRVIERAEIRSHDVFVDVGSGVGRATALIHLLTGAAAIGLEIQPHLVQASRVLSARLALPRCRVVSGDAVRLAGHISGGSVFFLYCPFSGERLANVVDALEPIARTRTIRICCLDLELPARPWLTPLSPQSDELAVYRSTLLDGPAARASSRTECG